LIPKPISFIGAGGGTSHFGTVLLVKNSVKNSTDILRLTGNANGTDGMTFRQFSIQPSSPGIGRHVINIDTTKFALSRLLISQVYEYGVWGGRGILTTNPSLRDGFYVSTIEES